MSLVVDAHAQLCTSGLLRIDLKLVLRRFNIIITLRVL